MNNQSRLQSLGLQFPNILLPAPNVDLERWAVIACDQFTSDQAYWDAVDAFVGDAPSTLRIILPEIYLEKRDQTAETTRIQQSMKDYVERGVFRTLTESAVFVERTLANGTVREGLVLAVDLESYDYHPETEALVRASEETIPSRLPPRASIRGRAPVETPHVLVLYNDPHNTVLRPLQDASGELEKVYDTPLMMGGGSVRGRRVPVDHPATEKVIAALEALRQGTLLFATGDGNHSLAAAKTVWEQCKSEGAPEDDPYRYCLVELVNVYDPGLPFHPIHRVARGDEAQIVKTLERKSGAALDVQERESLIAELRARHPAQGEIAVLGSAVCGTLTLPGTDTLPVELVDDVLAESPVEEIDYIHGFDEVREAAERMNGLAFVVPEFDRDQLFPTVASRGTLPRKAFSLGLNRDKRYYLECRSLV